MIKNIIENNKNVDINTNKINKLKELFPNCFNSNGEFDMPVFEEELKSNTSIVKEGYGLNFLGKNYAKYISSLDTETILVPDEENNKKEENKNSENIYISGDNIDALKHLVKSYTGQIKCIYIDPPYNTGSDGFVYNDKFNLTIEKLVDVLDINEEEAKRIHNMTNNKSNSHSAWLTFMYPRLYIAKQLLKEDGVIFISIDDNEQSQLKLLCDSIFGEENFLAQVIVKNNPGGRDYGSFALQHEYLLVYSKNENTMLNMVPKKDYKFQYVDEKGGFDLMELRNRNIKFNNLNRPNLYYPFYINPNNSDKNGLFEISLEPREDWIELYPKESQGIKTVWRWGKEKSLKYLNDVIKAKKMKDGGYQIVQKSRISEKRERTIWDETELRNEAGSLELKKIFNNEKSFDYPKSVDLIKRIIYMSLNEEDIVLDFFSGSATTAQAVMEINSVTDLNLKYIMVQLPELCDTKSEAHKSGYKTIDEIGQERIRRAAKKIKEETNANIDYGFKHYTIKDVNTNTLDKLEKFEPNYVISDGSILDEFGINAVLTTWMNEDGYGLTDNYEKLELEDYTAYKCQNTIYLLNWNISDLFIKALIEKYEKDENFDCNRVVMFGYSFTLNEIQTLKDNLQQVKNIKGINVEVVTRY